MLQAPVSDKKTKPEASRSEVEREPERLMGLTGWGERSVVGAGQSPVTATQQAFGNQAALRMMRGQRQRSPVANPARGGILHRKCACGSKAGMCTECQRKRELQRKTDSNQSVGEVPAIVYEVLASPGQPLAPETRTFMASRFKHDFKDVRVHTDAKAADSAKAVNALAYTVKRNVVFGSGQYAPATSTGQQLLAHELAHVVQQNSAVQRFADSLEVTDPEDTTEQEAEKIAVSALQVHDNSPISSQPAQLARQVPQASPPAAPQPTFGADCSGGANDPCQLNRCTSPQRQTVNNDLTRAIQYVNTAISALNAAPLASNTIRALDWYFNSHESDTINAVKQRLGCINSCLTDTQTNSRYGCHPDYNALAYVCVGSIPVCNQVQTDVCLTDKHFGEGARERAQVIIHECAHRVGMSLGTPNSVPDIYRFTLRFAYLNPDEALLNSDSFALFASAISAGIPLSIPLVLGLSGGVAISSTGASTWQARLYLGTEFQHPVLGMFNPTLGIGMGLIGQATTAETSPVSSGPSLLYSLLPGFRLGNPRPGAAGGGYASFFGGPSLALNLATRTGTGGTSIGLGAEAGAAFGYRWQWIDVSAGVGYTYDPTRQSGLEHLFTGSVSLTFIPQIF